MANFLEERIKEDGRVINSDILKVDAFLNQQVDPQLMEQIGREFKKYFDDRGITKVVTIEASGIAPALTTSIELGVPLVIMKKQQSSTLNGDILQTQVKSFTKNNTYNLVVSKKFICDDDVILIIDDFLAMGEAALGAIRIINNTKATVAGVGIVIEKSFQPGRKRLEEQGIDVHAVVRVKSLKNNEVKFEKK